MLTWPYSLPSYVFSPKWFYGYDTLVDLIAVITCLLLVFYSYKCYKFTAEKRYLYFSTAFLSIMLSFIAKVGGTMAYYMPTIKRTAVGSTIHKTFKALTLYQLNATSFKINMEG